MGWTSLFWMINTNDTFCSVLNRNSSGPKTCRGRHLHRSKLGLVPASLPGDNFINVFTSSFHACRSQKLKKDSQVKQLFALLESVHVKPACKNIDEIEPSSTMTRATTVERSLKTKTILGNFRTKMFWIPIILLQLFIDRTSLSLSVFPTLVHGCTLTTLSRYFLAHPWWLDRTKYQWIVRIGGTPGTPHPPMAPLYALHPGWESYF